MVSLPPALGALPEPPPFKFRRRHDKLDWRQLTQLDVDRIETTVDIEALEPVLENVAYARVTREDLHWFNEDDFLRLQRVQQMLVEYLIYVQEHLHARNVTLESALEHANAQLLEQADYIGALEEQLRRRKIETEHAVMTGALAQCPCCLKAFSTFGYLDAHLQRRHPNEAAAIIASRPIFRTGWKKGQPSGDQKVDDIVEGVRSSTVRDIQSEVKAEVSAALEQELGMSLRQTIHQTLTEELSAEPDLLPRALPMRNTGLSVTSSSYHDEHEGSQVQLFRAQNEALKHRMDRLQQEVRQELSASNAKLAQDRELETMREMIAQLRSNLIGEARMAARQEVGTTTMVREGRGAHRPASRLGELRDDDEDDLADYEPMRRTPARGARGSAVSAAPAREQESITRQNEVCNNQVAHPPYRYLTDGSIRSTAEGAAEAACEARRTVEARI